MRRGWRLPDFSYHAADNGGLDDGWYSDPEIPTRGWGWDNAAAAAASSPLPEATGAAQGVDAGENADDVDDCGSAFQGLARRLTPYAPHSAQNVLSEASQPPSTPAEARRALSRCSRDFALRQLQQHTARWLSDSELSEVASETGTEESSDSSEFCRICREGGAREGLITPCDCRGTVRFVHKSCLERWLAESDTSFCEICGLRYVTQRSPRYGLLKSVFLWALAARHDLFVDLLTVLTFVPLAVLGTSMGLTASRALCNGILLESDEALAGGGITLSEDAAGNFVLRMPPGSGPLAAQVCVLLVGVGAQTMTAAVVAVMAAMDIAVSAWLVLRVQQHVARCYSWWRRQFVVRLVYPPPAQATPPALPLSIHELAQVSEEASSPATSTVASLITISPSTHAAAAQILVAAPAPAPAPVPIKPSSATGDPGEDSEPSENTSLSAALTMSKSRRKIPSTDT